MRGDEDILAEDSLYLVEVENLRGVPIFSPSGRRVGALDSAVVSRYTGDIRYVVINCSSMFGLRRKRYVLPRSVLQPDAARGGFCVDLSRQEAVSAPLTLDPLDAADRVDVDPPAAASDAARAAVAADVESLTPPPPPDPRRSGDVSWMRRPPLLRLDPARPE